MKTKTFDCVQMKQRCQEQIRRELGVASREDEMAYFRRSGEQLAREIQAARASKAEERGE